LAGADLAGQLVQPIDTVQLDLGRGEKLKIGGERGAGANKAEREKCRQKRRSTGETAKINGMVGLPDAAASNRTS
jgi:hypothetical protein